VEKEAGGDEVITQRTVTDPSELEELVAEEGSVEFLVEEMEE